MRNINMSELNNLHSTPSASVRTGRLTGLLALAALSFGAAGCETPRTETLVFVEAEQGVRRYVDEVRVQVRRLDADSSPVIADHIVQIGSSAVMPQDYPVFVGLVPEDDVSVRFRVDAVGMVDGQEVVSAATLSGYTTEETRSVIVTLDDACIGVRCDDPALACRDGMCVAVAFDAGTQVSFNGEADIREANNCYNNARDPGEADVDCGGACGGCLIGQTCDSPGDCASQQCTSGVCSMASCDDGIQNGGELGVDCGGDCEGCPSDSTTLCIDGDDCLSRVCDRPSCSVPSCSDAVTNGPETDVDCGGGECPRCRNEEACLENTDCVSGLCELSGTPGEAGICRPNSCENSVRDGDESDVDCGGSCMGCATGARCEDGSDCLGGLCTDGTCAAPACDDGTRNGDETDVDCGGSCPERCADSSRCGDDDDCQSASCSLGLCLSGACADGTENGDETDVDCGGSCAPCTADETCITGEDCDSAVCVGEVCAAGACDDGVLNGTETDADCGGSSCAGCTDGEMCNVPADCLSNVCVDGECVSGACADLVMNGDETDVDCGGTTCAPCRDDDACAAPDDCESGVCEASVCIAPTCGDGVRNGEETDVDCGGPVCGACGSAEMCVSNGDCLSDVCVAGLCDAAGCADGAQNGDETDIDCGGTVCSPCDSGERCAVGSDCTTSICMGGVCGAASCTDSMTNGLETDTDCGGGVCNLCADGQNCATASDCATGVCNAGTCSPATCTDTVENGDETAVDCGGSCPAVCSNGDGCRDGSDCQSGTCVSGVCASASCSDGTQNGGETDVDCGGSACPSCDAGDTCGVSTDCSSGVCASGTCGAGACSDGAQNGDETDVDCGGSCSPCGDGLGCALAGDCTSDVCSSGACASATCVDGVANGSETDEDCGGPCPACEVGESCAVSGDCETGVCSGGTCVGGGCSDGAQNNDETDVDCGGPMCADCGDGLGCGNGGDCVSGVCAAGACQAATCSDSAQNGNETDMNCGGPDCLGCPSGSDCNVGSDCASGTCTSGQCAGASCTDGVLNGAETAIDCGGGTCPRCPATAACGAGADCESGSCSGGTCDAASCTDGRRNGGESDIDCGLACAASTGLCEPGDDCGSEADCAPTNTDTMGMCMPETCSSGLMTRTEWFGTCSASNVCGQTAILTDVPGTCPIAEGGTCSPTLAGAGPDRFSDQTCSRISQTDVGGVCQSSVCELTTSPGTGPMMPAAGAECLVGTCVPAGASDVYCSGVGVSPIEPVPTPSGGISGGIENWGRGIAVASAGPDTAPRGFLALSRRLRTFGGTPTDVRDLDIYEWSPAGWEQVETFTSTSINADVDVAYTTQGEVAVIESDLRQGALFFQRDSITGAWGGFGSFPPPAGTLHGSNPELRDVAISRTHGVLASAFMLDPGRLEFAVIGSSGYTHTGGATLNSNGFGQPFDVAVDEANAVVAETHLFGTSGTPGRVKVTMYNAANGTVLAAGDIDVACGGACNAFSLSDVKVDVLGDYIALGVVWNDSDIDKGEVAVLRRVGSSLNRVNVGPQDPALNSLPGLGAAYGESVALQRDRRFPAGDRVRLFVSNPDSPGLVDPDRNGSIQIYEQPLMGGEDARFDYVGARFSAERSRSLAVQMSVSNNRDGGVEFVAATDGRERGGADNGTFQLDHSFIE